MKICLGICGSIAAYQSVDFAKDIKSLGHDLRCVLTQSAREFVSARVLETFSGQRVLGHNIFDSSHTSTDHIQSARWADVFVIYGASANFLARAAQGFGDDFLSLQLLAFSGRLVIAPAMNPSMWSHPAVQQNVQTLRDRGAIFVGPVEGIVACGESGVGHLAKHEDIVAAIQSSMPLALIPEISQKQILISAGPMRTAVDSVRFVQNRSSGQMGLSLARACKNAGAKRVHVLLGPVEKNIQTQFMDEFEVSFYEGPQSYEQQLGLLFVDCDIFFSAAAVLDFELISKNEKMERSSFASSGELKIPLRSVEDIVSKFALKKRADQKVVAFAAESGSEAEIIARATQKMLKKGVDVMIANPVWEGLGPDSEKNKIWILKPNTQPKAFGPELKTLLARPILENL